MTEQTDVCAEYRLQRLLELEAMAPPLLATARKLPRGQDRHELLKEIGRLRVRINALRKRKRLARFGGAGMSVTSPFVDPAQ